MLSPLITYPLIGGSSSLVNRVLQRFFPTPLEKAQYESIQQTMILAREEVAAKEVRAEKDWNERRALLMAQLEGGAEQDRNRDLMQKWPLGVPAAAIVRTSQERAGRTLNVIVVPNPRALLNEDPRQLGQCWTAYNVAADRMQDSAARLFGDDVLFYWENLRPSANPLPPRGQELISTLYSLTSTEPTVLVQFALISGGQLQLSWSTWGWAGDNNLPEKGSFAVEIDPNDAELDRVIEKALIALVCALSDRFQLLRHLQSVCEPRFPKVCKVVDGLRIFVESEDGNHSTTAIADSLVETYVATLDQIAQRAPHLACDFAARAALLLHHSADTDAARHLLDRALQYYVDGLADYHNEHEIVGLLMERFFEGPQPLKVQLALRDVRGLSYNEFVSPDRINEVDEIIYRLGYFDSVLCEQDKDKVRAKLMSIISYQPVAGIMGKCGAGKSSMGNALFGKETFKVGHTHGTTRKAQDHEMTLARGHGITILDMPGVGENIGRDVEYEALYKEYLPKIDVLLWAIKADDRALSIDEQFYKRVIKPHLDGNLPMLIVITQADAIHPMREWDMDLRKPGPEQALNLSDKRKAVAKMFKVKLDMVIAISAVEKFNLQELTYRMVLALPNEKRVPIARAVLSEHKNVETYRTVARSIDTEVTKSIGDAWQKGNMRSGIFGGIFSVGKHVWKSVFG